MTMPTAVVYKPVPIPSDRLWFDPAVIQVNSQILQYDVACVMGQNTIVAKANPRRYMLGIVPPTSSTGYNVSPWNDADQFPFAVAGLTPQATWIKLFDYGPLVCNQWSLFVSSAETFRIIDISRT